MADNGNMPNKSNMADINHLPNKSNMADGRHWSVGSVVNAPRGESPDLPPPPPLASDENDLVMVHDDGSPLPPPPTDSFFSTASTNASVASPELLFSTSVHASVPSLATSEQPPNSLPFAINKALGPSTNIISQKEASEADNQLLYQNQQEAFVSLQLPSVLMNKSDKSKLEHSHR